MMMIDWLTGKIADKTAEKIADKILSAINESENCNVTINKLTVQEHNDDSQRRKA